MHQILIVDEEEHLLWALEKNLLPDRDNIKVITASSGDEGLDLLRDENIDVLICDIKMPGKVDGFQLILRAKEVAPDARVVIMTAFGTNRIQNLAERVGITHYVEKPFNISDLRNVVLELLDAKEGFQGVLSDLELTDIIQMLCLAKRTALLHLKHRDHRGKIVFERGDVTHAEFDDIEGADAVYQMLVLRQGDIYMQSDFINDKRTIQVGWQDLLLEGVRRADEHRANISSLDDSSSEADEQLDHTQPFSGVFEDSGEITLGMPPRLVSDVDHGAGDEPSAPSFFTDEELAEIEGAGSDLTGTANGFDRIIDSGVRELIEKHEQGLEERTESQPFSSLADETSGEMEAPAAPLAEEERTESQPFSSPEPAGEQPRLGRPTESSDFPAQPRALTAPSEPRVVAEEVRAPRMSGGWNSPSNTSPSTPALAQAAQASSSSAPAQAEHHDASTSRAHAPTVMLEAPGILSSRKILEEFAQDCREVTITGLFSFDDGLALDFHAAPGARYEEDVLAAFFRDVAACADKTSGALGGERGFLELQVTLAREIVLLRRVANTPYVHIAVMAKNVRLGIALVLMRRYGERLAQCFNA